MTSEPPIPTSIPTKHKVSITGRGREGGPPAAPSWPCSKEYLLSNAEALVCLP